MLNRRDFSKLSMAALAGAVVGCDAIKGGYGGSTAATDDALLLAEPHVCRGLNACKGKGACKTAKNACKGKNVCAGQGACATAKKHGCHKDNACKGQGGCGKTAGRNTCKGKGECAVPLGAKTWKPTRASFATAYKAKHGKAPGAAPAKK
jgi:hypothetical protein